MSEDAVLEQREHKPHRAGAPDSNGHVSDVPDFSAAEDFAAAVPAGDSTDVPEQEDVEEQEASTSTNKIYFVRVPRPPINDEALKKLSAQFNEHVNKVKGVNARISAKREELRELRKQLNVGRSLKEGSQPEFEEKFNRLQSLRNVRNNYQQKMANIRETLRGLSCKTEEELDAKLKALEDEISLGGLTLREEKQQVHEITKLKSQRAQIREYDNQKTTMDEMEAENNKVKVVIAELESEFTILKTERNQAQGIIKEILTKVKACEAEVKDLEEEQKEVVNAKNDALATLDKARAEVNDSMSDYRDNRSFSLKVRDLVTAGQVDEARAQCTAQIDAIVAKITTDAAYRKEYYSLWAQQRKYAVSELLPDSTMVVKEAKAADQGKPGSKGKAEAKGVRAPPPKPQGAEKARQLIEQLMAEAQQELTSRKLVGRSAGDDTGPSSGDADDELDSPSAGPAAQASPVPVIEAVKPKATAASARPADLLKMVELPKIIDEEFVPPVIKTEEEKAAAKAARDKERQREEQIRKAQEAEARKKKLAEAKDKKRKEMEAKRKADEEVRKAEAAAQEAERVKQLAAARAEAEAKRKAAEAAAKAVAEAKASYNPAAKVIAKSQVTVAAKAKPPSNDLVRHWKALKKNTNLQFAILGAVLTIIMLVLVVMAMRS